MQEKLNVLRILNETKKALEKHDATAMKDLSNQTINTASLTQDPDNIAVAVIVYSLGKILEKHQYQKFDDWKKFHDAVINSVNRSINDLKSGNDEEVSRDFGIITNEIGKLSEKLKGYIQDVFWKARINKASRIYEHGISMEKTARLLGITLYELASYAGQARIDDAKLENTLDIRKRIKIAEEFFR